jgi:drug/metabolite transporter (DMT)-like permease
VFWGFVVASVFWLLFQLTQGRPDTLLDTSFTLGIFFLGIVGTIAPFLLFVWGLRIVSASAAGVVSTLEPVAAAGLAFWWLGQTLTPLQSFGAASVIVGIAIVQTHRPPSPEVLLESTAVE